MRIVAATFGPIAGAAGILACSGQVVIGGVAPGDAGAAEAAAGTTVPPSSDVPDSGISASRDSEAETAPPAPGQGNAGTAAPGNGRATVTLTTDGYTLPAGAEAFICQTFANPFGRDADIVTVEISSSEGDAYAHDAFLLRAMPSMGDQTPGPLHPCPETAAAAALVHPMIAMSTVRHSAMAYPDTDMGYRIAASDALMIAVHFLNTGSSPGQATTSMTVTAASPGAVTKHIGSIVLVDEVPASATINASPPKLDQTFSPSASDGLPLAYSILVSWMGAIGIAENLQVTAEGMTFYTYMKSSALPSLAVHSPAVSMLGDWSITWSCTYTQTGSGPLGTVCGYQGQYFPADPKNPDVFTRTYRRIERASPVATRGCRDRPRWRRSRTQGGAPPRGP